MSVPALNKAGLIAFSFTAVIEGIHFNKHTNYVEKQQQAYAKALVAYEKALVTLTAVFPCQARTMIPQSF